MKNEIINKEIELNTKGRLSRKKIIQIAAIGAAVTLVLTACSTSNVQAVNSYQNNGSSTNATQNSQSKSDNNNQNISNQTNENTAKTTESTVTDGSFTIEGSWKTDSSTVSTFDGTHVNWNNPDDYYKLEYKQDNKYVLTTWNERVKGSVSYDITVINNDEIDLSMKGSNSPVRLKRVA